MKLVKEIVAQKGIRFDGGSDGDGDVEDSDED
jgi:hypothetical protein